MISLWYRLVKGAPLAMALVAMAACRSAPRVAPAEPVLPSSASQTGTASWYGPGFQGRPTASGELYDQDQLTAAHRTLPLGTRVRVTNLANRRAVTLRINDRGPFVGDRIIDVSRAAAVVLEMIGPGTARVRIDVLDGPVRVDAVRASVEYTLQFASYTRREQADALRAELARAYPDARVVVARVGDATVFRVHAGAFATRADADAALRIAREAGRAPIVVEK